MVTQPPRPTTTRRRTTRTATSRSKSTSKKSAASKKSFFKSTEFFMLGAAILVLISGAFSIFTLSQVDTDNTQVAKEEHKKVSKPKKETTPRSKINNTTYNYAEILENEEVDSGSGVKVTRNYEAEKLAKEKAYRKELALKRKKAQEALAEKQRKIAEQKRLREERRLARLNKNTNSQVLTTSKLEKGKKYIFCEHQNYRTVKEAEAQKAKLAFLGKESKIISKNMGGGYVYTISIGPYNTLKDAQASRAEIINSKLAKVCKIQ